MPIAASFPLLKSQIATALNLGPAANQVTVATMLAAAVGSSAPMGLFPTVLVPVPLAAAGQSAGQVIILASLSLGPAAQQKIVAQIMAQGVSIIAPLAPPVGLSILASKIESALSLGASADQKVIAEMIAQGIIIYYTMGGVL